MARARLQRLIVAVSCILLVVLLAVSLQLGVFSAAAKAGKRPKRSLGPATACFFQPSSQSCSPWRIVAGANISPLTGSLSSVAAIAANNVWAVGGTTDPTTHAGATLAEQWNGTTWSVVTTPNPPTPYGETPFAYLDAVAASAPNDVWAVGDYYKFGSPYTLIEHFDGTSWSIIPSPNASQTWDQLSGVAANSSTDAWAAGYYQATVNGQVTALTYTLHWDGTQWAQVSSPNVANSGDQLASVAAVSATDVWAVGFWSPSNGSGVDQVLVEHWDGTQWSIASTPTSSSAQDLSGVAVTSASNVWAVGTSGQAPQAGAIFDHWNGSSWGAVPATVPSGSWLEGVASVPGTGQAWAAGYYIPTSSSTYATFIEQYYAGRWTQVVSPNLNYGTWFNQLYGVDAVSATEAWAVGGARDQNGNLHPLLLHYQTALSPA